MIRFVHLSDIHLGLRSAFLNDPAKQQQRRKDIEDSFADVINYCLEVNNSIDGVLFTGDLFDKHNPDEHTLNFARAQIRRLIRSSKVVFHIPGNHDSYHYGNSIYKRDDFGGIDLVTSPDMRRKRSIELNGEKVHVYGMAFTFQSQSPFDEFQKEDLPGYHVAMLHGSISGLPEWNLLSREVPLTKRNCLRPGLII